MWLGGGVSWGYCVCSWLFESAKARKIVPVGPHLLVSRSPEASRSTAAAAVEPHLPNESPKEPHLPGESPRVPPISHMSTSAEGCDNVEHFQEDLDTGDESAILEGVVICFSKKLSSLSSEETCHMFHT